MRTLKAVSLTLLFYAVVSSLAFGQTTPQADIETMNKNISAVVPEYSAALKAAEIPTIIDKKLAEFRKKMIVGGMGDNLVNRHRDTLVEGTDIYEGVMDILEKKDGVTMKYLVALELRITLAMLDGKITEQEKLHGLVLCETLEQTKVLQIPQKDQDLYDRAMNSIARKYEISDPQKAKRWSFRTPWARVR